VGYLSTEGGPLLLVDRAGVGEWSGIDGGDYERACKLLDAQPAGVEIEVGQYRALLWGMPTGTTEIWRISAETLLLSRPWLAPEDSGLRSASATRLAALPLSKPQRLGQLAIASGWLAILWATDPGTEIVAIPPTDGATFDLSVGDSAIVVALPVGTYRCLQDEVRDNRAVSVRCWILPEGTSA